MTALLTEPGTLPRRSGRGSKWSAKLATWGRQQLATSGHARATGDALVFLDADDVALPGRLAMQREAHYAGYEFTFGRMAFIDKAGKPIGWHRASALKSPLALSEQLRFENPISLPTVSMSRELFIQVGGFDSSVRSSEDRVLWVTLFCGDRNPNVAFLDCYLTAYRLHAGSKTTDVETKLAALMNRSVSGSSQITGIGPNPELDELCSRRRQQLTAANTLLRSRFSDTTRFRAASRAVSHFAQAGLATARLEPQLWRRFGLRPVPFSQTMAWSPRHRPTRD